MRKNKIMRVASALLVAVLLSTCAISSTFAKYVTSDSSGDVARVAKWGVVVSVTGTLYGDKYAKEGNKITALTTDDAVSVKRTQSTSTNSGANNVVAPGTSSDEGFHIAVNGKPEVDTVVTVNVDTENIFLANGKYGVMVQVADVTEDNFDQGNYYVYSDNTYTPATASDSANTLYKLTDVVDVSFDNGKYWPVVYTLTGDTSYEAGTVDKDSLAEIANQIRLSDRTVEQNTDLSTLKLSNLAITWKWAFEQPVDNSGESENTTFRDMCDGADTILANLMAERIKDEDTTSVFAGEVVKLDDTGNSYSAPDVNDDYCLDTSFNIEITVTQVD